MKIYYNQWILLLFFNKIWFNFKTINVILYMYFLRKNYKIKNNYIKNLKTIIKMYNMYNKLSNIKYIIKIKI